jgi:quinol monooxygenase YgiN
MSVHVTASFRVRPEAVPDATTATRKFVAAVRASEPGTLEYRSLRDREDHTMFLSVMRFADEAAEAAHRNTEHVRRYIARLYPLCSEEPAFRRYEPVEPGGGTG